MAMRRKVVGADERPGARTNPDISLEEGGPSLPRVDEREVKDPATEWAQTRRMTMVFGLLLFCILGGAILSTTASKRKSKPVDGYAILLGQSDEEVFNMTKKDVSRFQRTGDLPTFGLSKGRYHYMSGTLCTNCALKLRNLCGYDPTNATAPPLELLKPGRLSKRSKLSEFAQCFLWYANSFWTRPTGGKNGFLLTRLGAGIDDKSLLVTAMDAYEKKFSCKQYQVIPPTLDLNTTQVCNEFFHHNDRWAEHPNSLWFMKAADGSTGRHVHLLQRKEVEEITAAGKTGCPRNGSIASLEVPNLWTVGGHKFDNRIYLFVPSMKPLTILFRRGHLRFSVQNYTLDNKARSLEEFSIFGGGSKEERTKQVIAGHKPELDAELARHVTNPRFGLSFTNDSSQVIQPFERLWHELVAEKGHVQGEEAWAKLQKSVKNAALQAFYSLKDRYAHLDYHTRWGFVLIAMDVAYDKDMNAYILDVNSGPSFYHEHEWPAWFVKERSSLIREAIDHLQEAAFLKVAQSPNRSKAGMQTPDKANTHGWDLLYEEAAGGVKRKGVLAPGLSAMPRNQRREPTRSVQRVR